MSTSFPNIPTMAEVAALRAGKPLTKSSKLDRAHSAADERKEDERKLAIWRREVAVRDKGEDRYTGKRVLKTITLDPNRAEAHHVEPRDNYDTRYDRRNGVQLSMQTHVLVTENKLRIVGTKFFTVNGKRYIDCDHPVTFRKVRA